MRYLYSAFLHPKSSPVKDERSNHCATQLTECGYGALTIYNLKCTAILPSLPRLGEMATIFMKIKTTLIGLLIKIWSENQLWSSVI